MDEEWARHEENLMEIIPGIIKKKKSKKITMEEISAAYQNVAPAVIFVAMDHLKDDGKIKWKWMSQPKGYIIKNIKKSRI
jgi:hypothetical protein